MRGAITLLALLAAPALAVPHGGDQGDDNNDWHRYDTPKQCKVFCGKHDWLVNIMQAVPKVHDFCHRLDSNYNYPSATTSYASRWLPDVTVVATSTSTYVSTATNTATVTNTNWKTTSATSRTTLTVPKTDTAMLTSVATDVETSTEVVGTEATSSTTSTDISTTTSTTTSTDYVWATFVSTTTIVPVSTVTVWTTYTDWTTTIETSTTTDLATQTDISTAIETATATDTATTATVTAEKRHDDHGWVETPLKLRRYDRHDVHKACRCLPAPIVVQTVTFPAATKTRTVSAVATSYTTTSTAVTQNVDTTVTNTATVTDVATSTTTSTGTTTVTTTTTAVVTSMSTKTVTGTATVHLTYTNTVTATETATEGTITMPATVYSSSTTYSTATSTDYETSTLTSFTGTTSYTTTTSTSTSTTTTTSTAPPAGETCAAGNLIINPTFGSAAGAELGTAWTFSGTSSSAIYLLTPGALDTDRAAYLSISSGGPGTTASLSQTVSTVVGSTYTVSFREQNRGGSGSSTLSVSVNNDGASGTSVITNTNIGMWSNYQFTFQASAASTTLTFKLASTSYASALFGMVSLQCDGPAQPSPSISATVTWSDAPPSSSSTAEVTSSTTSSASSTSTAAPTSSTEAPTSAPTKAPTSSTSSAAPTQTCGVNLLKNSEFGTADAGVLDPWLWTKGNGGAMSFVAGPAGGSAIYLSGYGESSLVSQSYISQTVATTPGKVYTVTFQAYLVSVGTTGGLYATVNNNIASSLLIKANATPGQWNTYTLAFPSTSARTTLMFKLTSYGVSGFYISTPSLQCAPVTTTT